MKTRDSRGKFVKKNDSELILAFPSIKTLVYWISLFLIFLPWIAILSKFNLFEKIVQIFDSLFNGEIKETQESGKKNGLFY